MKSLILAIAALTVLTVPVLAVSSVPVAGSITGTTVPSGLCVDIDECKAFLSNVAVNGANGSITGTLVPSGLCSNGNEQNCLDFLASR